MEHPGAAGSRAGGQRQPAGADVVVPMEAAAPAAAAAPPAAWSAWTLVSARVTWTGAAAPPAGSAGAPAWTPLSARLALAAALFLLGCAAAGLALFAMTLPPADSRLLGKAACAPPTDAEVASLRTAAECLLLAASAQVLAATMGLLVPGARVFSVFGNLVGLLTGYHAVDVLCKLLACHGSTHGALTFHFWVFFVFLWPAIAVCFVVSLR